MYETKRAPLLSRTLFIRRIGLHVAISTGVLLLSLLLGMVGYEYFESLAWRDAFLNSAMLLGGMGPVNPPLTNAGKIFAGLYALYAGLVFLIVVGLVLAPLVHRILHKFHWDQSERK